jgi:hypothetical protein
VQRTFSHNGLLSYHYEAAELSFPAPGGLSGGPVVTMPHAVHVLGLVTENWESTTFLQSVEEVQDNGGIYKETTRAVVNYGICVRLLEIEPWLSAMLID